MICNKNSCDYNEYYSNQAGGSLDIAYYNRSASQQGYGYFTTFAKRYGIPVLKYLLKKGISVGKDVIQDVAEGKTLSHSTKSQLKKRTAETLNDISKKMKQSGTGLRKKPKLVKKFFFKNKKVKRKKVSKKRRKRTSRKKLKHSYKDIFV